MLVAGQMLQLWLQLIYMDQIMRGELSCTISHYFTIFYIKSCHKSSEPACRILLHAKGEN